MKVGPYEVLRKLGEGAYGKVYLARKGDASGFATWYALKRIARAKGRGPEFEGYLFREARLGGIVNHPNLVRVHEVLSLPREWVLVQDYVDGVTLRSVLERRRTESDPVPREVALELAAELLETLYHLHTLRDPEGRESGFIHRDVKPGNVMLSDGHLKVMDFGVARGEEAGAGTLAGELRGTLAYMAPEQATGDPVGPASDQFAAGLILLEMLSNGSPWGDVRGPAVLGRVVTGDVSAGLGQLHDDDPVMAIVMRMLGRDPQARYPDAQSAARDLRALRAQTPTPPALRDFCSGEVARSRAEDEGVEVDDQPSWTGSWQWVSRGSQKGAVLAPEASEAVVEDVEEVEIPFTQEDESAFLDDDRVDLEDLAQPAAASAVLGDDAQDPDLELDLEEDPSDGVDTAVRPAEAGADGELGLGGVGLDEHRTLPLETTPGARVALLRSLGLSGDGPAPTPPTPQDPRDSLASLQARFGDLDPQETLPIAVGTTSPEPAAEVVTARPGEPAQAGAPGPPPAVVPAVKPTKRRRAAAAGAPKLDVSVGAALWEQFARSPLLGAGILLVLVVFIAATVRLAWVAVQPGPQDEDGEELFDEFAVSGSSLTPPPVVKAVEAADVELPGEAVIAGVDSDAGLDDPLVEGAETDPAPAPGGPVEPVAAAPGPTAAPSGQGLDADMITWRGEQPTPAPPVQAPRPGQIIGGAKAGERLLEESTEERRVATRRGLTDPVEEPPAPEPATDAPPATAATLNFLSSREQPATVPLSIRVRPDGFYPSSVVVYYQWRGEGSAGRRRRALTRQGNGGFSLDIPVSEVRVDRLQLWFVAEPGDVTLGSAADPQEVRVR